MATLSQAINSMSVSATPVAPASTKKYTRNNIQGAKTNDIIIQLLDRVVELEEMVDRLTTKVLPQYKI